MIGSSSKLLSMRGMSQICELFISLPLSQYVHHYHYDYRQVLLEHAPLYFRYIDTTASASKPTVLVKLMGFYTIEIKDLESGAVQTKTDLLVMENLFYGLNITKKFDLKGIQGRKVKSPGNTTKTLYDGEWIEGIEFPH